jgi:hypothetical protein
MIVVHGFGPPVKPEELVLAGGTAFPGCARLTCCLETGWKACVTNSKMLFRADCYAKPAKNTDLTTLSTENPGK